MDSPTQVEGEREAGLMRTACSFKQDGIPTGNDGMPTSRRLQLQDVFPQSPNHPAPSRSRRFEVSSTPLVLQNPAQGGRCRCAIPFDSTGGGGTGPAVWGTASIAPEGAQFGGDYGARKAAGCNDTPVASGRRCRCAI